MMKKLVLGAAVASAVLAAAPAHATLVSYTASGTAFSADSTTGLGSTSFGDSGIAAGNFTDTLKFTTGTSGTIEAGILITAYASEFSKFSAKLNGVSLNLTSLSSNFKVFTLDLAAVPAGLQTLVISGISKGGGAYSGGISAPVPEPSTWALSILGFGLIGGMLRSRRQTPRQQTGSLAAA